MASNSSQEELRIEAATFRIVHGITKRAPGGCSQGETISCPQEALLTGALLKMRITITIMLGGQTPYRSQMLAITTVHLAIKAG